MTSRSTRSAMRRKEGASHSKRTVGGGLPHVADILVRPAKSHFYADRHPAAVPAGCTRHTLENPDFVRDDGLADRAS
ncbi:hypothetical protein ACIBL8_42085 [Streptomyces sp. NPDC050523]|uniref:hypothetical protein n=1 Tax=Streptomyces sp. NPDC050523 TaxID=3365622 RepID=UPI0037A5BB85